MAVKGDSGGKPVCCVLVSPEKADELRGIYTSSKQLHETFVLGFGFMSVNRL